MLGNDNHATGGAHVSLAPGSTILNGKYSIVQQAGTGNFARVFEAVNTATRERVAVKVLKKGYERDADFECDVLNGVAKHDQRDTNGLVRLIERGSWNGHALIVFTLKGAPLRSLRLPMTDSSTQEVLRDVASALAFLHFTVRAVHTDLKPENILAELASSSGQRKWCICDLGSASFYRDDKPDTDLITTRPYRAPEVVLQRGWCHPSDAWSLGCILYELKTGRKLFDCHNDNDHVRMMETKLGPIPSHLKTTRAAMNLLGRSSASSAMYGMPNSKQDPQMLSYQFRNEPQFLSLLLGLLEYDPTKRMRCDAVLKHPYVTIGESGAATVADAAPALRPRALAEDNISARSTNSSSGVKSLNDQFRSSSFRISNPTQDQENFLPKFVPVPAKSGASALLPPASGRRSGSSNVDEMMIEMKEKPAFPRSLSGGYSYTSSQGSTPANSLQSSPVRKTTLTSPSMVLSSAAYGAFHGGVRSSTNIYGGRY